MLKPGKLLRTNCPTWPVKFTDTGKSCPSCEFLTLQICLLTLFVKIKSLQKFPDLQYLQLSSKARSLIFGLHLLPYLVYASNEASGTTRF